MLLIVLNIKEVSYMNKISFFSALIWSICGLTVLIYTPLVFYRSMMMWAFTVLFSGFSAIHVYTYYLQEHGETARYRRFQKLRMGIMIVVIGWFLGVASVITQYSPQRTFKERIELWIDRLKTI